MAYCTGDDIVAEFKALDITSSSAIVTSDKVDEFISQASGEIDARLASKFIVPISADGSLPVVKTICIWLVADRINKIIDNKIPIPSNTGVQVVRTGYGTRKDALQMLEDIMNDKIVLIGSSFVNPSGGISSRNVSHNQRHEFHKNKVQW